MGARDVIRATEEANQASAALRKQLQGAENEGKKMIAAISNHVSFSEWLEQAGERTARVRNDTHDSLIAFQRARHSQLRAIVLPSLKEGMSIADLGRAFGVSRQLASRWAREARSPDSSGT